LNFKKSGTDATCIATVSERYKYRLELALGKLNLKIRKEQAKAETMPSYLSDKKVVLRKARGILPFLLHPPVLLG